MSERKRSKGLEAEDQAVARGTKKQKLEENSSLSEQENISLYARREEEDFLSSPGGPASGSEHQYSSPGRPLDAFSPRQAASDSEAFPLIKGGGGLGEKRKVRRYRGVADTHNLGKEAWERNERDRRRRTRSREPEDRLRVEYQGRTKRSSSARSSPQHHREAERPRRSERRERGREIYPPREHSLKRRLDDRREDNRRASYAHEREERLHSRERREPLEGRRVEQKELLRWREERDRQRDRLPREQRRPPQSTERHKRLLRPAGEEASREWERSRERAARKEKGRERHHHKHSRHRSEEVGKPQMENVERRIPSASDSESDESPLRERAESEKIDDLIKELEEGEEVSLSESERSEKEEEHERVSEESYHSESEMEGSRSDASGSESSEKSPEEERRLVKSVSVVVEKEDGDEEYLSPETEPGVSRSKFDADDEEEEEQKGGTKRPLRKGYSGYEAFATSDASEDDERVEEADMQPEKVLTEEEGMEEEEEESSPVPELPSYLPALMGCRNVENYEWLNRIEEGTYGVVYRAKDKRTGQVVALKKLKMEKEKEGFPITSLREINMLLKAEHPNIVHVREIVVGNNMDKIYIVMDYVEHDLKSLMETMKQPFLEGEVKTLMLQLLSAVHHLHDNWILHRDLKASNLLLSHKGILKVGDFGLAREYGSPLKPYTPVVVTLWYRAPELLLGVKEYSTAVDMWSVGCIFAEFLIHKPLFQGKSEIDQLNQIFKELGTPSEEIWPGYNELPFVKKVSFTKQPYNHLRKRFPYLTKNGFDLLNRFLTYDPKKRNTAEQALKHEYFKESPLPVKPSMFPTWPARSEMVRKKRERSPQAPEGGAFKFNKDDAEEVMGFRLTQAQHGHAAVGAGFSLKF